MFDMFRFSHNLSQFLLEDLTLKPFSLRMPIHLRHRLRFSGFLFF